MRLQLIRKEDHHKKIQAITSQQMVSLKKEIAELVSQKAIVERENELMHTKCKDLTTLLETSYDQHEEDQVKMAKLTENLKRLKKKHDDSVEMVKKEAALRVMNTQEERKSLKAHVERLRCALNSERKEWLDSKQAFSERSVEYKNKMECLDRELREARAREKRHRMLQEQLTTKLQSIQTEVEGYRRELKVAQVMIESYKTEICRVVEETMWKREVDGTLSERMRMAEEDNRNLLQSRSLLVSESSLLKNEILHLKQHFEAYAAHHYLPRIPFLLLRCTYYIYTHANMTNIGTSKKRIKRKRMHRKWQKSAGQWSETNY
jgi:hypothetical protein